MRLTSKLSCVATVAATIALTGSADARPKQITDHGYNGAYASIGDVTPPVGRDFVYGPNRAPYGADQDNPRDFQLQGTN